MFLSKHTLSSCLLFIVTNTVLSLPEVVPDMHKKHINAEHHDVQYDHEKFLGEDESKLFDTLSPEESKRRLGLIADKIDADADGFVDMEELRKWIQFTQRKHIDEDATRQWKQHTLDRSKNETIHWDDYKKSVYGFLEDMDPQEIEREDDGFSYKAMVNRDRRRWAAADENNDDKLTFEEFTAFLHPEDVPRMRDVVILETLHDIDRNKDGKVSLEEYIGDIYKSSDDEEEPDWVVSEREIFTKYRDQDKDGFLDKEEIREWITPKDFDHAEAEAKHLIYEADSDEDNRLTKEEILEKYDVFVGSQATDFGEALNKHDEF